MPPRARERSFLHRESPLCRASTKPHTQLCTLSHALDELASPNDHHTGDIVYPGHTCTLDVSVTSCTTPTTGAWATVTLELGFLASPRKSSKALRRHTDLVRAMGVSETAFDPSAAELINLRTILEACMYIPDIGDTTRHPGQSREQRFCSTLERFETTARVFDQSYYESLVLHIGTKEEELDERLRREARDVGVPEAHHPSTKRRRAQRSSKTPHFRIHTATDSIRDQRAPSNPGEPTKNAGLPSPSTLSPPPQRSAASSRPSYMFASNESWRNRRRISSTLQMPTPSASVLSFQSTSSHSSWLSNRFEKRRDSLVHFFRRDSSRASSVMSSDQSVISPATTDSFFQWNKQAIAEEPELVPSHFHEAQDLSSVQSVSMSSRTSISSFSEHQPFQELPITARQDVDNFVNSRPFLQLRAFCEDEMIRFNGFVADQHVALPLIIGRNQVYNKERQQSRLSQLQKQHTAELEKMEDRHAEKEVVVRENLRLAMEENAGWNATAVKHVARRIALLGDEATPEHLQRLEEEQSFLDRLAARHEADLRSLVRYQESRKLELVRKQEKEFEDVSKSMELELDAQRKDKAGQLQSNIAKLDDLVEDRRAKLVARWFLRLQILKMMSNETATMQAALPLSLLGMPTSFTYGLGYS